MASPQTPVTPPNQVSEDKFSTRWTFQETFSIVRSAIKAIIFYAVAPCADHHSTRMAGRGVHPQQTGRNKQSIFFLSYYISNINSNKRSSPLASYSVHFFGFFFQPELSGWCPVGAADLLSEGAAHVRSPTPGTDQTWGGGIKNGSIKFKPPFSAIRLGE